MATQNDAKIKELLNQIEQKKTQMGTKPRASWRTNGVINEYNINTINSIGVCILLAAELLNQKKLRVEACEFLGVESVDHSGIDDALEDIKLRAQIIKWDEEKKKLSALESKLKNLRSEDAKTEDALADIMKDI